MKFYTDFKILKRHFERSDSVLLSPHLFERPILPRELFSMSYNISRDVLYFSDASELFLIRSEFGLKSSNSLVLSGRELALKPLKAGARRLAFV